jgi:DNA integrity scanning protein DisA with diadenylate cyclase activity
MDKKQITIKIESLIKEKEEDISFFLNDYIIEMLKQVIAFLERIKTQIIENGVSFDNIKLDENETLREYERTVINSLI